MLRQHFRLYSREELNNLIPVAPKSHGSRLGFIGKFPSSKQLYMLKVENSGYVTLAGSTPDERCVVESFCSQIVRAIFGANFAADIHMIELPYEKNMRKYIGNGGNIKIRVNSKFAVFSLWEENSVQLNEDHLEKTCVNKSVFARNLTRAHSIAMLINMDDLKPSNMVAMCDGSDKVFLVDCAANFSAYNRIEQVLNPHSHAFNLHDCYVPQEAIQAIRDFAAFDLANFIAIAGEYQNLLPVDIQDMLLNNFTRTHEACRYLINKTSNALARQGLFASDDNKPLYNVTESIVTRVQPGE